jgi:hypothetical protein
MAFDADGSRADERGGVTVFSEESLADSMACGTAGEAGSTFAGKSGLGMNYLARP